MFLQIYSALWKHCEKSTFPEFQHLLCADCKLFHYIYYRAFWKGWKEPYQA